MSLQLLQASQIHWRLLFADIPSRGTTPTIIIGMLQYGPRPEPDEVCHLGTSSMLAGCLTYGCLWTP